MDALTLMIDTWLRRSIALTNRLSKDYRSTVCSTRAAARQLQSSNKERTTRPLLTCGSLGLVQRQCLQCNPLSRSRHIVHNLHPNRSFPLVRLPKCANINVSSTAWNTERLDSPIAVCRSDSSCNTHPAFGKYFFVVSFPFPANTRSKHG